MKRCFLFVVILIFNFCTIKKNILTPNGPFGIFSLYFNLSKIGIWNYTNSPAIYGLNQTINPNIPKIPNQGIVKNYSLSSGATLPTGLLLDRNSGIISGTPTLYQADTEYTIYANNDFFNEIYPTKLKISLGAINYTSSNFSFAANSVVSIPAPTLSGANFTNFTISPALPSTLSFNNSSGAISGIAGNSRFSGTFTVIGTSSEIKASTSITINFVLWEQEAYIKAPNGESADNLGRTVAISGDTIVVSAIAEDSSQTTITNGSSASADNSATNSGAAYVFKRNGTTWTNEAYLKAPNAEAGDNFGWSTSIDGDTIVVGAYQEDSLQTTITNGTLVQASDTASNTSVGAAYVFKRNGTTWTNEAYLKAPNAEANDNFGYSVSISGDTIVVGAYQEDSLQTTITNGTLVQASDTVSSTAAGAAYVFKRNGTTWTNEAYLKAPNAGSPDNFGAAVSISGDTIVVGAYYEASNQTTITNGTTASSDNSLSFAGAAYVFKRNGTTWTSEAFLKPPNIESQDSFGTSVSISGDTIIVGAYQEDSLQTTITNGTLVQVSDSASNTSAGAVYVFKRNGTIWTNEAYLKPPNIGANDWFSLSISISGDLIAVGAYREDSNQTTITNGATIINDDSLSDAGAVYVFKRTDNTWASEAYLKAPNAETSDNLGYSVSISGDTIVAGAVGEDSNQTTITNGTTASSDNLASSPGAVYVFRRK